MLKNKQTNKNYQKRNTLGSTGTTSAPALSSSSCSTGTRACGTGRAAMNTGMVPLTVALVGTKASINEVSKPTRPLFYCLDFAYSTMNFAWFE